MMGDAAAFGSITTTTASTMELKDNIVAVIVVDTVFDSIERAVGAFDALFGS